MESRIKARSTEYLKGLFECWQVSSLSGILSSATGFICSGGMKIEEEVTNRVVCRSCGDVVKRRMWIPDDRQATVCSERKLGPEDLNSILTSATNSLHAGGASASLSSIPLPATRTRGTRSPRAQLLSLLILRPGQPCSLLSHSYEMSFLQIK